jgi:hypothetical protein
MGAVPSSHQEEDLQGTVNASDDGEKEEEEEEEEEVTNVMMCSWFVDASALLWSMTMRFFLWCRSTEYRVPTRRLLPSGFLQELLVEKKKSKGQESAANIYSPRFSSSNSDRNKQITSKKWRPY